MTSLYPIISSVMGVFLVMAVGAICRRTGWLTPQADRTLASLTANVTLPAYFIHKILGSEEFGSLTTAWPPPLFGFFSTAVGFGIGLLFARVVGPRVGLDSDAKQRAFALCVGICNYGYIPLPLAEKFYPEVLLELILHNVGVDLALWSVGIMIISGSGGGQWKKAVFSAPLLGVVFASSMRLLSFDQYLPDPILTAIGTLGDCAIPLGLLLGGAIIVDFMGTSGGLGSWKVIASGIFLRQLVMPALMLTAAMLLTSSVDLKRVMILEAAMPVAIFPIVLVRLYERDTKTAIEVVLSTSIAGIVLIPAWLAIGAWWLGL
ncbi:Membrane transport protein [Rubripirellula amarantea]|uniref:Membrane transport protein n=1 Tax=Rubripirellula amarantea TaxID=2527999 RepID=A0A5C5WJ13_9BACT|nr:AEC family transporter [Rubripirellula amarantea]TWT50620.1 Membrane transport protein [Rubripirellula amarantea]